jgi:hypothetical protein
VNTRLKASQMRSDHIDICGGSQGARTETTIVQCAVLIPGFSLRFICKIQRFYQRIIYHCDVFETIISEFRAVSTNECYARVLGYLRLHFQ